MSTATKLGKMTTYLEWLLPINSHDRIITWSCKIPWQSKIIIYLLTLCLWLSVLVGWQYTMRSFLPWSHQILSSCGLARSCNVMFFSCCITTNTRPMATKLGKVMIYYKKLQFIKPHKLLNMWLCEVPWQIKISLSPLPQYLWLPNLGGWLHLIRSFRL